MARTIEQLSEKMGPASERDISEFNLGPFIEVYPGGWDAKNMEFCDYRLDGTWMITINALRSSHTFHYLNKLFLEGKKFLEKLSREERYRHIPETIDSRRPMDYAEKIVSVEFGDKAVTIEELFEDMYIASERLRMLTIKGLGEISRLDKQHGRGKIYLFPNKRSPLVRYEDISAIITQGPHKRIDICVRKDNRKINRFLQAYALNLSEITEQGLITRVPDPSDCRTEMRVPLGLDEMWKLTQKKAKKCH